MNLRTTILGVLFASVVVYALASSVVYPRWIKPLVTIKDRIADKEERYNELKKVGEKVEAAKRKYRAHAARVGSLDIVKVETELRDRLNQLIEKHKLQDASTTPSRPKRDQKTALTYLTITIKGKGTLQSAVEFMRDVAELPQLARVTNAAIYPASRSKKDRGPAQMNVRVPIEILIPPQHTMLDKKLEDEDLKQPETFVRHAERDYSPLWNGTPFTPEPDYKALKVDAGKDVNHRKPQNRKTSLTARATGGDGQFTCKWEPVDGIEDPSNCRTKLDVSEAYDRTYVVTVADGQGKTATDTLRVVVKEPPPPRDSGKKPKVVERPVKEVDPRWKHRKNMQLVMVLGTRSGADRAWEVMIDNKKAHQAEYYKIGQDFDGGKLVALYPTGALVHRKDGYFIYPIGSYLDEDFSIVSTGADRYPDLKAAAQRLQVADDKKAAEESARKAAEEAERKAAADAAAKNAAESEQTATPVKPGATKTATDGKQPGRSIDPANVPKTGKPGPEAGKPGARTTKPTTRKTTRGNVKRPGTQQRPGVRAKPGTSTSKPPQAKPAATTGKSPGTPVTGKKQQVGKKPKFKPRNLGSKPGEKPEPAGDEKSGSDAGKEGTDKTNEKEKSDDKKEEKGADEG